MQTLASFPLPAANEAALQQQAGGLQSSGMSEGNRQWQGNPGYRQCVRARFNGQRLAFHWGPANQQAEIIGHPPSFPRPPLSHPHAHLLPTL